MHAKYSRRPQHAERALFRRQSDGVVIGGFTLTGPLTITLINTIPPVPTPSTTSSTLLPPSTRPVQTTPPPTLSPPLPTLSPTASVNGTVPNVGALADNGASLAPGAIAGIIITIMVVVAVILFFALRRQFQQSRVKLRTIWTNSRALTIPPPVAGNSYEPKQPYPPPPMPPPPASGGSNSAGEYSPGNQFAAAQAQVLASQPPATPAPVTYDNDTTSAFNVSPSGFSVPIYSPGTALSSPFSAVVTCTFIPSLPDELTIKVGETMRVLAEYDDAWALCMNSSGEQGMIPLECLNRGGTSTTTSMIVSSSSLSDSKSERRASRRGSSLDPRARASKDYRKSGQSLTS